MLDVEHGNYENAIEKFKVAFKYIESCCKCSVRHFKDDWNRELAAVTAWISNPLILVLSEKKRLLELKSKLLADRPNQPNNHAGIDESLVHISQRLLHIEDIISKVPLDKLPTDDQIVAPTVMIPGSK